MPLHRRLMGHRIEEPNQTDQTEPMDRPKAKRLKIGRQLSNIFTKHTINNVLLTFYRKVGT